MNPLQTNRYTEKKRNKIIIIIVSILLLICIVYILIFDIKPKIESRYYGRGYFDGQLNIIQTINSAGEIPVVSGEGNNTIVDWITIQEICRR